MNDPKPHLSLAVLFLALPACSAGTKTVAVKAPEGYAAHAQHGGIAVGVEAYDTWAKSDDALGAYVSREFTPVHLLVENRALEKFMVDRGRATLTCSDGATLEAVGGLTMYESYRGSTVIPTLLGARLVAAGVNDDNDKMRTLWAAREFPAQTVLAEGRQARGFLYFRGACQSRLGRTVHVTFDKLTSADAITLEVPLKL